MRTKVEKRVRAGIRVAICPACPATGPPALPAELLPREEREPVEVTHRSRDRLIEDWLEAQTQLGLAARTVDVLVEVIQDYLDEHGWCHAGDTGGEPGPCPCYLCVRARAAISACPSRR